MPNRKKIGLALGGGVVRGIAHIGVLATLEEAGIPIDYLSGTSAGSIAGALYCSRHSIQEMEDLARHVRWWTMMDLTWPRRGFLSFQKLENWLDKQLDGASFSDLKTPFAVMAVDLDNGRPVEFRQGKVAAAVHASCCVPGIITPKEIDGRLLGDGSLADTVPVNSLRKMGAEYVIGVDVFSSSIRPLWGPPGMSFTAIEILVQRAGGGIDSADCLITPKLKGFTYWRFSKADELLRLGRQAAMEKLPQILAEIEQPDRVEEMRG